MRRAVEQAQDGEELVRLLARRLRLARELVEQIRRASKGAGRRVRTLGAAGNAVAEATVTVLAFMRAP